MPEEAPQASQQPPAATHQSARVRPAHVAARWNAHPRDALYRNMDTRFVERRRKGLEAWLQWVVRTDCFIDHPALHRFLDAAVCSSNNAKVLSRGAVCVPGRSGGVNGRHGRRDADARAAKTTSAAAGRSIQCPLRAAFVASCACSLRHVVPRGAKRKRTKRRCVAVLIRAQEHRVHAVIVAAAVACQEQRRAHPGWRRIAVLVGCQL